MDTTDWLKSIVHEECGMDSSSSPSGEIISCARPPVMERRLRPQHDQPLKCPRCDSTHTKFCYYNNYSLSQPRYFCKTCRRYWTKGGSLRNVPVGGGCRKNKRPGSKKPLDQPQLQSPLPPQTHFGDGVDLHLSSSPFPALQLSHLGSLAAANPHGLGLMECKYGGGVFDGGEFFGSVLGNPRNLLFVGGGGELNHCFQSPPPPPPPPPSFHTGFPAAVDGAFMESYQRLALPLEVQEEEEDHGSVEMKPAGKLLSLEWHDQGCTDVGRDGFGYSGGGLGLWAGMMNGSHASSPSNPLI